MRLELDDRQKAAHAEFRAFAEAEVAPCAAAHDTEQRFTPTLVRQLAERGYLASLLPRRCGGRELDTVSYALLHEEIGRACPATRSLLTVHDMVAQALLAWGTPAQRETWLPRLASGAALAAFTLSEPDVGSDAQSVRTRARRDGDGFVIDGDKSWITFGALADLFLLFARTEEGVSAFLVERSAPGLLVEPIHGMLGMRGAMLASLRLRGCRVPAENLLGRPGRGHPHVTLEALTYGRLSVACGSVGILQACLDASVAHARGRRQFDTLLEDHQLVRRMIADMVVNVDAARLLCVQAAYLIGVEDPRAPIETSIAKHFAAGAAARAARDAVQIHGALGCRQGAVVERLYREAKIMEIIEGSNEIQELMIGKQGYAELPSFVR